MTTSQLLINKVNYFFKSPYRERGELRNFVDKLKEISDVSVYGGMLRDILMSGNRSFTSDIDLVVSGIDSQRLNTFFLHYDAIKNKYGGYRACIGKWRVDVWLLENTWANKHNHISIQSMQDLTRATFFNWDAIVFNINRSQLIASDNYFCDVSNRYLDINLAPNPNPLGNAIRAIRAGLKHRASISTSLVSFIYETINHVSDEDLISNEFSSHQSDRYLPYINLQDMRYSFYKHLESLNSNNFSFFPSLQYNLFEQMHCAK